MALLDFEFNVDSLPVSESSYEPIPAGWYTASIKNAEIRQTKNGTGQYIAVRYDIQGPSHSGRVIFGNINIKNANPKAEEIGRQQLGEVMRAIGLSVVRDTDQLIGGTLQIKVDISHQDGYEPRNEVRGYKAVSGGSAPGIGESASTGAGNSGVVKGATPPWAKK